MSKRSERIAKALRKHGKTLGDWVRPTKSRRNFTEHKANCFLVGVLFDQQVSADRAWDAAEWIAESIGDQDTSFWTAVQRISERRLVGYHAIRMGRVCIS